MLQARSTGGAARQRDGAAVNEQPWVKSTFFTLCLPRIPAYPLPEGRPVTAQAGRPFRNAAS
jgi:hypothetical protein